MAVLPIRVLGDPILRERTMPVAAVTDELRALIDDMFETMYAAEGIGLAAPQVGRSERITVVDVDDEPLVLVNPEITARDGAERAEEGCLSIPEIYGEVERASHIVVRALDRHGSPYERAASALLARCIQHEVDHLDGKLFLDYLSPLKRRLAARKWEKEAPKYAGSIRVITPGATRPRRSRSREIALGEVDPEL